jgi:hypothetical protein
MQCASWRAISAILLLSDPDSVFALVKIFYAEIVMSKVPFTQFFVRAILRHYSTSFFLFVQVKCLFDNSKLLTDFPSFATLHETYSPFSVPFGCFIPSQNMQLEQGIDSRFTTYNSLHDFHELL